MGFLGGIDPIEGLDARILVDGCNNSLFYPIIRVFILYLNL